jgi:pyruvate/2-oxoglutarate dehydrogenase complex dihydrolipoamide acyltransferase (E2) component
MQVDVVMPKMGESIQEGKILRWMKKPGDKVEKEESILEISTDKVDSEIPSSAAGVLTKIIVPEGETVEVGTVIATIETNASAARVEASPPPSVPAVSQTPSSVESPIKAVAAAPTAAPASSSQRESDRFYSPLVRTIAKKEGIALEELDQLSGTGIAGRVTKRDVMDYLDNRSTKPSPALGRKPEVQRVDLKDLQRKYPPPLFEVVQMDNVQLKMAEHMVRSVHSSPHVEAISECDVTRIVDFRSKNAERFEQQEGFKLSYTPFFLGASIRALKAFPIVNSSVEGDKIIVKRFINFGIAVASRGGLIVPVIKNAEEKNFLGLARAVNDLALRTRNKKLSPDEVMGGTFTITNYGVFGNTIGTPIINQPQVAILGVGAIKKRPVVVPDAEGNDCVAIRSIVFLTLAFDHRIIDGAIGGQFLEQVISNLEQYDFSRTF